MKFKPTDYVTINSSTLPEFKEGEIVDIDKSSHRFPYVIQVEQEDGNYIEINFAEFELNLYGNNGKNPITEIGDHEIIQEFIKYTGDKPKVLVPECQKHEWTSYVGLTQSYNYCKICDKKEGHL